MVVDAITGRAARARRSGALGVRRRARRRRGEWTTAIARAYQSASVLQCASAPTTRIAATRTAIVVCVRAIGESRVFTAGS